MNNEEQLKKDVKLWEAWPMSFPINQYHGTEQADLLELINVLLATKERFVRSECNKLLKATVSGLWLNDIDNPYDTDSFNAALDEVQQQFLSNNKSE